MALLDDLAPGMMLQGIRPHTTVTLLAVTHHGADSAEIIFKDAAGRLGSQLVYRADTDRFEVVSSSLPWSFSADGAAFRLVSEAYRIRLAYLTPMSGSSAGSSALVVQRLNSLYKPEKTLCVTAIVTAMGVHYPPVLASNSQKSPTARTCPFGR